MVQWQSACVIDGVGVLGNKLESLSGVGVDRRGQIHFVYCAGIVGSSLLFIDTEAVEMKIRIDEEE